MHNPFLIVRLILLSLLVYLNLATLAFATWNIHATTSGALPVPGAALFLIFNNTGLCFLIALALLASAARTAQVKFECLWAAVFGVLQIAATIGATVNGPFIMCQPTSGNWEACASSSLLVPTAWLSTFTLLSYLFVLFITTVAHLRTQPDIWSLTVCSVPWFGRCKPDAHWDMSCEKNESQQCCCSKKGDVEALSEIPQNNDGKGVQPPWAQRLHIRRGVDKPFASVTSSHSSPTNTLLPPPPDAPTQQSRLAQPEGSRFVERFQESQLQPSASWWETPAQYGLPFTPHAEVFPRKVDDHDLPIALPRLSEWIRADAVHGIDVHTLPLLSPSV